MEIYNIIISDFHQEEEGGHECLSFYKKEEALKKYEEECKIVKENAKEEDTLKYTEFESYKNCHYINDNNDEKIITFQAVKVMTDIFYQLSMGDIENTIAQYCSNEEALKMQQFSDEQILDVLSHKIEIDYMYYIYSVLKARFLHE